MRQAGTGGGGGQDAVSNTDKARSGVSLQGLFAENARVFHGISMGIWVKNHHVHGKISILMGFEWEDGWEIDGKSPCSWAKDVFLRGKQVDWQQTNWNGISMEKLLKITI
jgi:hypothetical protein